MVSNRATLIAFSVVIIYLTLFYQLGGLALVGADEARYARIAEEMNLRGNYVTPTLEFRPWLEKPPLLFWLQAASFKLFGVSEWSARLPVGLTALLTLMCSALLGLELGGRRAAYLTILILATSPLFFIFGRSASTDMLLTAMLTAALFCGFRAATRPSPLWGAGLGAALALATLAKGPVALILAGGIFVLYFLFVRRFPWSWSQTALALVFTLALAVPWYWQIWVENGYDFVATFWLNHHLARFLTDLHHHSQPFWYFLPVLIVGFFPWTFFLGSSAFRAWKLKVEWVSDRYSHLLFLWLWVLVPLLFFSLSESKLAGYILPVLPALALLAALEWEQYLSGDLVAYRAMKPQMAVLSAFTVLVIIALIFGFHFIYDSITAGVLVALPLAFAIALVRYEFRKRQPARLFLTLVAGMSLFAALAFWKAAPVFEDYHSAQDLSLAALPLISQQEPLVLYRYFHHTAQYYTGYQTTREAVPDLQSLRRYRAEHPQDRYYVLTQEPGWRDLQTVFSTRLREQQGNLYLVELQAK